MYRGRHVAVVADAVIRAVERVSAVFTAVNACPRGGDDGPRLIGHECDVVRVELHALLQRFPRGSAVEASDDPALLDRAVDAIGISRDLEVLHMCHVRRVREGPEVGLWHGLETLTFGPRLAPIAALEHRRRLRAEGKVARRGVVHGAAVCRTEQDGAE